MASIYTTPGHLMVMVSRLENDIAEAAVRLGQLKGATVHLVTHRDSDGLACHAILSEGLKRAGFTVGSVMGIAGVYTKAVEDVYARTKEGDVVIFADLGSSGAGLIAKKHLPKRHVFILDHHPPKDVEELPRSAVHVNPHISVEKFDETSVCASAIAYKLVKCLIGQPDAGLAAAATVGISGDRSPFASGLNPEVVEDAGGLVRKRAVVVAPGSDDYEFKFCAKRPASVVLLERLISTGHLLFPSDLREYDALKEGVEDVMRGLGMKPEYRYETVLEKVQRDSLEEAVKNAAPAIREKVLATIAPLRREAYSETVKKLEEDTEYAVRLGTKELALGTASSYVTKVGAYAPTEEPGKEEILPLTARYLLGGETEGFEHVYNLARGAEGMQLDILIRSLTGIAPVQWRPTFSLTPHMLMLDFGEPPLDENGRPLPVDVSTKAMSTFANIVADPKSPYWYRKILGTVQRSERYSGAGYEEQLKATASCVGILENLIRPRAYVLTNVRGESAAGRTINRAKIRASTYMGSLIDKEQEPRVSQLIAEVDKIRNWNIYGGGHSTAGGISVSTAVSPEKITNAFEAAYLNIKHLVLPVAELERMCHEMGMINLPAYYYALKIYIRLQGHEEELIRAIAGGAEASLYPYGKSLPVRMHASRSEDVSRGFAVPIHVHLDLVDGWYYLRRLSHEITHKAKVIRGGEEVEVEVPLLREFELEVRGRKRKFHKITRVGWQVYQHIDELLRRQAEERRLAKEQPQVERVVLPAEAEAPPTEGETGTMKKPADIPYDIFMGVYGLTGEAMRESGFPMETWGTRLGRRWEVDAKGYFERGRPDYQDGQEFTKERRDHVKAGCQKIGIEPVCQEEKEHLCDFVLKDDKCAVEAKWRCYSGDPGTHRKIINYGLVLSALGYKPVVLIVNDGNLSAHLSAFSRGGWDVRVGGAAFEFIKEKTGLDVKADLIGRKGTKRASDL